MVCPQLVIFPISLDVPLVIDIQGQKLLLKDTICFPDGEELIQVITDFEHMAGIALAQLIGTFMPIHKRSKCEDA